MIEIIHGAGVGAGKSYTAACRIFAHLCNGGTVWAADTFGLKWPETKALAEKRHGLVLQDAQFNTFPQSEITRAHELTPLGTAESPVLVVVDEGQGELNARDWADTKKRGFFLWLTQSRHDDTDILFLSQHMNNLDKQIVRLCTFITRTFNTANWTIPFLGKYPFKQFVVSRYDGSGKNLMTKTWLWHDKEIFKIYESKQMRGSHKRNGFVVTKFKLEKTKNRHKNMIKWILIIALISLPFLIFKGYQRFKEVKANGITAVAPLTTAPKKNADAATPAGEKKLPPFEIEEETFRGSSGGILRTARGEYEPRKLTRRGLCMMVHEKTAIIKMVDGRTLYVLAVDDREPRKVEAVKPAPPPPEEKIVVSSYNPATDWQLGIKHETTAPENPQKVITRR